MKSLFAKIFVWFWVASVVLTIASFFIAVFLTGTPLLKRWLANYADLYARNAVLSYQLNGKAGLDRYFASEQPLREVEATVLSPDGELLHGTPLTAFQENLLVTARTTGQAECRIRFAWQCAAVVSTTQGNFAVVARVPRPRAMRGLPLSTVLVRSLLMIAVVGALCFLLARYIARPVEALQGAARQMAAGDLSVRVAPQFAGRKDELVSLAEEFDVMAARIESLVRSQRQMLGDISHELRSPLTRLRVALELSEGGDKDALERMNIELYRMEQLIEQILTLNRLDAGEKFAEFEPVQLDGVLAEVARDANYEGRARNVTVELKATPVSLNANPALLKSCIENIVRNALRYAPPASQIELSARASATEAILAVRDRGPGVPAEALPRLFEPFYRVAESRSEKSGGRGLGLSIAQRAAAVHGGTISARNREGGGLEVEVHLPLRRA